MKSVQSIFFIIPAFFLVALLIELWLQRKLKKKVFHANDSIVNFSCGLSDRLFSVFWEGFLASVFIAIGSVGLFYIPVTWWSVLLLALVVDFLWYWCHRLGHETSLLWGVHILHHQSEHYNFSVGYRISSFQTIVRSTFWLVLPFLGFQPEIIFTVLIFHGVYQMPLHTQFIPRLGFLEYILVTPSAHRVHHGTNPEYIDKNYGGVFIFWDLLFGTYAKEEATVTYGITKKLDSYDTVWAHVHFFKDIRLKWKQVPGLGAKLKLLFSPPSQMNNTVKPVERVETTPDFHENPGTPASLVFYVFTQILWTVITIYAMVVHSHQLALEVKVVMVTFSFLILASVGALAEGKGWAFTAELIRWVFALSAVPILAMHHQWGTVYWVVGEVFMLAQVGLLLWHLPFFKAKGVFGVLALKAAEN
ncbi:MAG: sterol desaturase family protein [Bacteroidota bacterium]